MSTIEVHRPHPGAILLAGKKHAIGIERNSHAIGISYTRVDIYRNNTGEEHLAKKGIPGLNVRGVLTASDGVITARLVKSDIVSGSAIAGDVEINRSHIRSKRLGNEGVSILEISPGTKFLDIDFMPTVPFTEKIPQNVTSTLFTPYFQRRALQDYLKFLNKLEHSKKLHDVQYVRCILPGTMAKLATQRFGFLEQMDGDNIFHSLHDAPTTIWGAKEQLLTHAPDVKHAIDQLRRAKNPADEYIPPRPRTTKYSRAK